MNRIFCCRTSSTEKPNRILKANDSDFNATNKFAINEISTTKYNLITFLPKNLFEQFQRLANIFFLFLLCLLFIPQVSSLQPITTLFSLILVLAVTALKDAVDDFARFRSDRQVNNRQTEVLINEKLEKKFWKEIQVGNIVKLINNEFIPADLIILSSSEPNGLCLIETAQLDGEMNLKPRQSIEETIELGDNLRQLSHFDGTIECESPNENLNRFDGNLMWKNQRFPLKNENLLLRGTRLRNTSWIFGVVCFAGRDTKLMQNTGKAKFKRTKIDHWMNKIILGIFIFLFLVCSTMSINCGFWEYNVGYEYQRYLPWESFISSHRQKGSMQICSLIFLSYVILLNTVVPISLYISIEIIRLFQSKWIDWDIQMYDEINDIPAQARTASLNEELGQIQFIFSDKTGTLTQNIMTFKKCSIREQFFGDKPEENRDHLRISLKSQGNEILGEEEEGEFIWYDQRLIDAVQKNEDPAVTHFFSLLALCHTVVTEENSDGKIIYQAQSPDENALVIAARAFGFEFLDRSQSSMNVRFRNREETFHLLNILDFNNYRKRMSVIVKKQNKIILYCKGADSVIKQRLAPSETQIMTTTDEYLQIVARQGLRTLCLAWKELKLDEYEKWSKKFKRVMTSMENRDEQLDQLYEEIEQNLLLIGMTAIEDKLQDEVPKTIELLTQAGIKIWVLTGDKIETAANIAFSSRLLTDEMIIEQLDDQTEDEIDRSLEKLRRKMIDKIEEIFHVSVDLNKIKRLTWENLHIDIDRFYRNQRETNERFDGFSLLIGGSALAHALSDRLREKFLELATMCRSVICCRVTPLQKAQVVELVMKHEQKITLAIGDGANDVSMIQKAHIGVGISGREGRQAVLASDFSIGQFRYLQRLLLVHGRWSYIRISKFLRYFFYKNFAFTFCQFWFGIFCGFTAQTIFDAFFVTTYNIFFSTVPVVVLGVSDQDVNGSNSVRWPHLYFAGQKDELFNRKIFFQCALHGLITSCVIFFFCYLSIVPSTKSSGETMNDFQSFGFLVATILIFVVNFQNALETWYWTWPYFAALIGTIVLHFVFHLILYSTFLRTTFKVKYGYVGVAEFVLSSMTFWLTLILICVILLLPIFIREFVRIRFKPTDIDKARLTQKFVRHRSTFRNNSTVYPARSSRRQSVRSTGSGYAFSQQKGWGPMIESGTLKNKSRRNSVQSNTVVTQF